MDETDETGGDVPAGEDPVRSEIVKLLAVDETALGDVWRRTQAGETPGEIRQARGTERSTFVWSYLRVARALVDGDAIIALDEEGVDVKATTQARRMEHMDGEPARNPVRR